MLIRHIIRKHQIFNNKLIVKAQSLPIYTKTITHLLKYQIVQAYNKHLTQEQTSKKAIQIVF